MSAFTKSVGLKTKRAVDLISDALPFGLLYDGPNGVANAIGYAKHSNAYAKAVGVFVRYV